jgi:hypothetical protein
VFRIMGGWARMVRKSSPRSLWRWFGRNGLWQTKMYVVRGDVGLARSGGRSVLSRAAEVGCGKEHQDAHGRVRDVVCRWSHWTWAFGQVLLRTSMPGWRSPTLGCQLWRVRSGSSPQGIRLRGALSLRQYGFKIGRSWNPGLQQPNTMIQRSLMYVHTYRQPALKEYYAQGI